MHGQNRNKSELFLYPVALHIKQTSVTSSQFKVTSQDFHRWK